MNQKQWLILAFSSMIIGTLFIGLDKIYSSCLNIIFNSYVPYEELNIYDVWCVVNAEKYEPFIYLFYLLFVVFSIISFLEPNKK